MVTCQRCGHERHRPGHPTNYLSCFPTRTGLQQLLSGHPGEPHASCTWASCRCTPLYTSKAAPCEDYTSSWHPNDHPIRRGMRQVDYKRSYTKESQSRMLGGTAASRHRPPRLAQNLSIYPSPTVTMNGDTTLQRDKQEFRTLCVHALTRARLSGSFSSTPTPNACSSRAPHRCSPSRA